MTRKNPKLNTDLWLICGGSTVLFSIILVGLAMPLSLFGGFNPVTLEGFGAIDAICGCLIIGSGFYYGQ